MLPRGRMPRLVVETPVGQVQQWLCDREEDSWRLVGDLVLAFTAEAMATTTWYVKPTSGDNSAQVG